MVASFSLGLLFAHWLAFLDAIQHFFWNYAPRPLLSTVFPGFIEDGSEFSPIIHVPPQIHDLPGHIDFIDVTTICLVPTILPSPSTNNVTCSIDRQRYDLDDVPFIMTESSHYYVSLDTPVRRPAQVPHEDAPPTSLPAQAQNDDARTNMTSYGARGLSFCPVLVGIMYIHSLLHLYMLLMIPSLFNHWFEDALVYDSLNPKDLLDFSWFLYTGFWIAPWHLFRYGTRKTIGCLCWYRRRVARISAHPPIPRIVLIRIDGEAVPVNFSEDFQANLDIGVWSPLEPAGLEVDHRGPAIEGGEFQDLVPCSNSGLAAGFESSMPTISFQSERKEERNKAQKWIGRGLFSFESGEGSQSLIDEVSDQGVECSSVFVEAENEPPHSLEENILTLPISDTFLVTASDSGDVQEGPGDYQQTPFLEVANNDIYQNSTDNSGDGEVQDQDPTLGPWIVVDGQGPYRSDAPDTASSSTGSQDTPPKNVPFAVHHDDTDPADDQQVPLGASCADERPGCLKALKILLCDNGDDSARTKQNSVDPFDTPMKQAPLDQATQLVFAAVLGEEAVEDIDMLTQSLTPPSPEQPVVNLPSLIAIREDVRFIEIDLIFPSPLMENIVTRSPHQIHCPIMPAVVIHMTSDIKKVEERLTPSESKELNQGMSEKDTPNGMAVACGTLDINSREYRTFPQSPSIEGLRLVCPSNVKDHTVQGSGISVPETMGLSTVLESRKEPGTEDQAGKFDNITTTLSCQSVSSSCTEATELLTTKPSQEVLPLPCNEASPLPMIPDVMKIDKLDDGKSRESNTLPQDHPKLILKPSPERTLSSSMHAPSEGLPDPQPKKHSDQALILYEKSLLSTYPLQAGKVDEDDEAVTNTMAENRSEREHDLFASIHAPTKVSKAEVHPSVSQSRDANHRDRRRSVTTPVVESEKKPKTNSCAPNWAAMPDVVDASRAFREAHSSENSLRRASSIAECTSKAPKVGAVGRKGIATNSLNNTCVTANMQSRWVNGSGLLLVRDLVPSDPADFNLRTCTNQRTLRSRGVNTLPMQQVLHQGVVLDVSPHALHHSTVPTAVQCQQSMLVSCMTEPEHTLGSQRWAAYRR